jgi:hypothetical protein
LERELFLLPELLFFLLPEVLDFFLLDLDVLDFFLLDFLDFEFFEAEEALAVAVGSALAVTLSTVPKQSSPIINMHIKCFSRITR